MPLSAVEVAYLEYIRAYGDLYAANAATLRQIAKTIGVGSEDLGKAHKELVDEGFLAVPSGSDPLNRTDTGFVVSITDAGKAALAHAELEPKRRYICWWNPLTWF